MKSMSQVFKLSECAETLDEARLLIDHQEAECRSLREKLKEMVEAGATLRDYLVEDVEPIGDIPDEIYLPFVQALTKNGR
jgi:hypothetical protein